MNNAKQQFKGCIRTVKKALKNEICQKIFNQSCKENKMLAAALKSVQEKNREHKELSFKWYR